MALNLIPIRFDIDEGVNDTDWAQLMDWSGLKDNSRRHINEVIALYRQHKEQPDQPKLRNAKQREFLEEMDRYVRSTYFGLRAMVDHDVLFDPFAFAFLESALIRRRSHERVALLRG